MIPFHTSELAAILHIFFSWNKARMNCLSQILLGLFAVRTVNLAELATTFSGPSKTDSNYKRLRRFLTWLAQQKGYQKLITHFILHHIDQEKLILSMDRTNWKFRGEEINILVLGVWYQGISIPLLWFCLGRAGNTKAEEKIKVIQDILAEIPASKIDYLLADREFFGEAWFKFLSDKGVRFAFRIKDSYNIKTINKGQWETMQIKDAFKKLKKRRVSKIDSCVVFKCEISLVACYSSDGDLVVIATNSVDPREALITYKKRWSIETLFACLKGRGFNFEDTRLSDAGKIEALLFILTLATFWSMRIGLEVTERESLKIGSHGRPRMSFFRIGLDILRKCIIQITAMLDQLIRYIHLLMSPESMSEGVL